MISRLTSRSGPLLERDPPLAAVFDAAIFFFLTSATLTFEVGGSVIAALPLKTLGTVRVTNGTGLFTVLTGG